MSGAWRLVRQTASDWYDDRAQRLGAALAFYTLFALAPGIVILIPLTGVVVGPRSAQGYLLQQLESLIGRSGADALEAAILSARQGGAGVTAVAVITLIFGLWSVFGELQDALNTIWGVTPRPDRGLLVILRERFWSFTLVVGIGFLLLVSLAVSAWLAALGEFFAYLLPAPAGMLETVNFIFSFAIITFLFAIMFKLLPDVTVAWRDVWRGAALTSLLFTLGKGLIGLYLGRTTIGSAYGAAGSLVIVLLWVYYSAQILFFGAEFTKVWRDAAEQGAADGRGRATDRGSQGGARYGASTEAQFALGSLDTNSATGLNRGPCLPRSSLRWCRLSGKPRLRRLEPWPYAWSPSHPGRSSVAKVVQLTQANGNPALVNAEAISHVVTPPTESTAPGARAIVYLGSQQLAVRETVAEIKGLL